MIVSYLLSTELNLQAYYLDTGAKTTNLNSTIFYLVSTGSNIIEFLTTRLQTILTTNLHLCLDNKNSSSVSLDFT